MDFDNFVFFLNEKIRLSWRTDEHRLFPSSLDVIDVNHILFKNKKRVHKRFYSFFKVFLLLLKRWKANKTLIVLYKINPNRVLFEQKFETMCRMGSLNLQVMAFGSIGNKIRICK